MWNFVVGLAVRLNLGGTGVGAAVRFRAAETWHSTVHDAPASRARCLCGMGFYNKASIVGPLWYRLDTLMREVIVRASLPVDDLAAYGSTPTSLTGRGRLPGAPGIWSRARTRATRSRASIRAARRLEPVEPPNACRRCRRRVGDMGFDSDSY